MHKRFAAAFCLALRHDELFLTETTLFFLPIGPPAAWPVQFYSSYLINSFTRFSTFCFVFIFALCILFDVYTVLLKLFVLALRNLKFHGRDLLALNFVLSRKR